MWKRLVFGISVLSASEALAEDFLFDSEQWNEMNTYLNQSLGDTIESILDGNPKFEPLLSYGKGSAMRRLSRPVGKLRIRFDSGKFTSCTATLVAPDKILTNNHCIPGSGRHGKVVQADLEMGYYNIIRTGEYARFKVDTVPLITSKPMDVSILNVDAKAAATYGWAKLGFRQPTDGDNLTVIHHPGGRVKHVTRGGCIAGPVVNKITAKFAHRCDTLPGSSGAPVFDADGELIAVHCCGTTIRGPTAYNYARLNALIPELVDIDWRSVAILPEISDEVVALKEPPILPVVVDPVAIPVLEEPILVPETVDLTSYTILDLYSTVFDLSKPYFAFEPSLDGLENSGPKNDIALDKFFSGKSLSETVFVNESEEAEHPFGNCDSMTCPGFNTEGSFTPQIVKDVEVNLARKISEVNSNGFSYESRSPYHIGTEYFLPHLPSGIDRFIPVGGDDGYFAVGGFDGRFYVVIFEGDLSAKYFIEFDTEMRLSTHGESSAYLTSASVDEGGRLFFCISSQNRISNLSNPFLKNDGRMFRFDLNRSAELELVWKSEALVCNSTLAIGKNRIFSGHGGTGRLDYLYEVSLETGKTLNRTKIPTAASQIFLQGGTLSVQRHEGAEQYILE